MGTRYTRSYQDRHRATGYHGPRLRASETKADVEHNFPQYYARTLGPRTNLTTDLTSTKENHSYSYHFTFPNSRRSPPPPTLALSPHFCSPLSHIFDSLFCFFCRTARTLTNCIWAEVEGCYILEEEMLSLIYFLQHMERYTNFAHYWGGCRANENLIPPTLPGRQSSLCYKEIKGTRQHISHCVTTWKRNQFLLLF